MTRNRPTACLPAWRAGTVAGKEVRIKSFETWLQKLEVDGMTHFAPMELSVKGWNAVITQAIGGTNE